jgi:predicted ATPase
MRRLPGGTVTFLFTDIEGSTSLLHELGPEAYAEALVEHRSVLRAAFARHGGVEVDTQGDAFFVAFPLAASAVAAAVEARDALTGPIRVRMGLHTGTPHVAGDGYVGEDVHLGARIAAVAHGGQVLLSQATRGLVDGDALDLGEHRLKDFAEAIWIYQLGSERFPPLKTISNTNLPRPASSFVGRENERSQVVSLLREGARLVTLTGPGGSGKTRLALEAAAELVPEFGNGVFWVGLAALRDPALVGATIGQTLGARNGLAEHVGERELLLLLDNLEQVVEAAPELAALVETCPNLRLLVTSRERLRVRGEVEYPVPPLATAEALELFCARSGLATDERIADLCRRLDDLPLAVELAAARTSVLSPAQILERLSRRLDLLRGGRDAEARQQTLRATIEWSHELLRPEEQRLFACLSVFAGGCTLGAAEQVAAADLDVLQSLVDKSLLRHSGERFWMLETIREYAAQRLEGSGEAEAVHRRLVSFFRELAEASGLVGEVPTAERLEPARAELDNLRAALEWSLDADPELGLRLAAALETLWVVASPIEGMRWLEAFIERAPEAPLELRAHALRALGGSANPAGRNDVAEPAYARSLEAFRALGDEREAAALLLRLGYAAFYRADTRAARLRAEESLTGFRATGNRAGEAQSFTLLAEVEHAEGHEAAGIELMERGAALAEEADFSWWRASALGRLSDFLLELGRLPESASKAREALRLGAELGDRQRIVRCLARLARIAAEREDASAAGLLWGAVEAEELRGQLGAWESDRERFESAVLARASDDLDRAREEGRSLSLDDAVERALASID